MFCINFSSFTFPHPVSLLVFIIFKLPPKSSFETEARDKKQSAERQTILITITTIYYAFIMCQDLCLKFYPIKFLLGDIKKLSDFPRLYSCNRWNLNLIPSNVLLQIFLEEFWDLYLAFSLLPSTLYVYHSATATTKAGGENKKEPQSYL